MFDHKKIQAVIFPDTKGLEDPISSSNINTFLDYLNLPNLNLEGDETEILKKIKEIMKDESLSLPNSQITEIDELIEENKNIKKFKDLEKESDILEISLTNYKVELSEIQDLKSRNLEEDLNLLNIDFNDKQFEIQNEYLLNQAYDFLDQKPVSKNFLNIFQYLKKMKNFDLFLEKEKLVEEISKNENILGKIFIDLMENNQINVQELEKKYGLERVLVLKIVYGMINNGIVTFDKERGNISMRK
ncbi:uncharacterized protein VNE69_06157 [Vairimorpha necatrix]|uniref:Uncharacterized protein n=1 Tax=Vairimorpha necatrix TaxID=6039 RepID=A0AAX4JDA2_9MICR